MSVDDEEYEKELKDIRWVEGRGLKGDGSWEPLNNACRAE